MGGPRTFTTDRRRLHRGRFVAVDCDPRGAQLTLSHHWYGNATPPPLRHDLASGAALNWAASPDREALAGDAEYVFNDHFDVDGFLAAWVALNPDEALGLRGEVLAAAASGDFEEWTGERAVQFALLGEAVEDPRSSALARRALELDPVAPQEALYNVILGELPELLLHPGRYDELWRGTYQAILRQVQLFNSGRARVEEIPAGHLSLIQAPRVVGLRAALASTRGDRVLQAVPSNGGWMYLFRYRPILGYRIISRPLTPYHDPSALARELNARWPRDDERWVLAGSWGRRLVLTSSTDGRRRVPRTPPEAAVPMVRDSLGHLDATHPTPPPMAY